MLFKLAQKLTTAVGCHGLAQAVAVTLMAHMLIETPKPSCWLQGHLLQKWLAGVLFLSSILQSHELSGLEHCSTTE